MSHPLTERLVDLIADLAFCELQLNQAQLDLPNNITWAEENRRTAKVRLAACLNEILKPMHTHVPWTPPEEHTT